MGRKIFKRPNKSKIRLDLEQRSDNWWLRSADSNDTYEVGYVGLDGNLYDYRFYGVVGVLPVCIIR